MFWLSTYCFLLLTSIFHLLESTVAGVLPPDINGDGQNRLRGISSELFESLEELALLVDISYCVGSTGIHKPFRCLSHCDDFESFELVTTWNTGPFLSDSCGYIALSHPPFPKRIIVAFRGTYSIANTVVDLSVYPQAYVPYKGDTDGDKTGNSPPQRCLNCTAHAGFLTSWRNSRSTVLRHVSKVRGKYPAYELVLIGHSLGGAVATLAGIEMQLRGWDPQVTTFGQPRVGSEAFVRFIDGIFGLDGSQKQRRSSGDEDTKDSVQLKFRRVTHVNDPVPLLPLEEWGYRMHAGEIFISKPDLPVSSSDLVFCDGDRDPRCIAGADEALSLMLGTLNGSLHASWDHNPGEQAFLSSREQPKAMMDSIPHAQEQSELSPPWSLIPSRYRFWELFFAHRDYFWRIGLCVPGGDPTGRLVY